MAARSDDADSRAARWEKEAHDLSTQVAFLQEELALVRRKLTESPRHVRQLEERLAATQAQLARLTENNDRLVSTLKEARTQIVTLKEEIDRLAQPPSGYGVFLAKHEDGTVDVFTGGRKLRVAVSPSLEVGDLRRGQEVLLNDALNIVDAFGYERVGEVVMLKEILEGPNGGPGDRALVVSHSDEERIVHLAETLIGSAIRAGDSLMIEPRSAYAYERIPKSEVEELVLEEVPDVDYGDIGGLQSQIEQIRDAVELPSCTRTCSVSTSSARPRASCSTARPAVARRSSPRRWPTRWPRRSPNGRARRSTPASSSTSRALSCSTSTSARPSGTFG